jgi:diadenosine tetraphosphate (Ap4A) HIT family hydrolase
MFALHPQLQADCIPLGRFQLCQLLLLNDATYPWFILVPERDDIREIYQLSLEDQILLIRESSQLAQQLADRFKADKMNIAALGNVVPQLHLHHIVRYRHDPAWPAPIWGKVPPRPYGAAAVAALQQILIDILGSGFKPFA